MTDSERVELGRFPIPPHPSVTQLIGWDVAAVMIPSILGTNPALVLVSITGQYGLTIDDLDPNNALAQYNDKFTCTMLIYPIGVLPGALGQFPPQPGHVSNIVFSPSTHCYTVSVDPPPGVAGIPPTWYGGNRCIFIIDIARTVDLGHSSQPGSPNIIQEFHGRTLVSFDP